MAEGSVEFGMDFTGMEARAKKELRAAENVDRLHGQMVTIAKRINAKLREQSFMGVISEVGKQVHGGSRMVTPFPYTGLSREAESTISKHRGMIQGMGGDWGNDGVSRVRKEFEELATSANMLKLGMASVTAAITAGNNTMAFMNAAGKQNAFAGDIDLTLQRASQTLGVSKGKMSAMVTGSADQGGALAYLQQLTADRNITGRRYSESQVLAGLGAIDQGHDAKTVSQMVVGGLYPMVAGMAQQQIGSREVQMRKAENAAKYRASQQYTDRFSEEGRLLEYELQGYKGQRKLYTSLLGWVPGFDMFAAGLSGSVQGGVESGVDSVYDPTGRSNPAKGSSISPVRQPTHALQSGGRGGSPVEVRVINDSVRPNIQAK